MRATANDDNGEFIGIGFGIDLEFIILKGVELCNRDKCCRLKFYNCIMWILEFVYRTNN